MRVKYQVMTLRNPYDGNSNTRINEAALQYRVGLSGNFTTLPNTLYQNNTVTQITSGVTTPQQLASIEALLPAECENQLVVQLRWVNRQIGGAGSRPSFAIDSVAVWGVSGDATPRPSAACCRPMAPPAWYPAPMPLSLSTKISGKTPGPSPCTISARARAWC